MNFKLELDSGKSLEALTTALWGLGVGKKAVKVLGFSGFLEA